MGTQGLLLGTVRDSFMTALHLTSGFCHVYKHLMSRPPAPSCPMREELAPHGNQSVRNGQDAPPDTWVSARWDAARSQFQLDVGRTLTPFSRHPLIVGLFNTLDRGIAS